MPVEKWSESVAVVRLGDDPQFTDDMESLDETLRQGRFDVVLDFSAVRIINSSNLARLLRLRKMMSSADSRLVLCGAGTQVWGVFLVTGLDKIFEFSDNVSTALATLQLA